MQIKFVVEGQTQVSRNLRILADAIPNLREWFDDALDIVDSRTHALFMAQGATAEKGPPWAALSPKTLRAREKRWGYYKRTPNRPGLLRWTGALEDQTTRQTTDEYGQLTHSARSSKGFNYPRAHQRGTGNLPQRVIIDITAPTIAELQRSLQAKINRDIGNFGRQV